MKKVDHTLLNMIIVTVIMANMFLMLLLLTGCDNKVTYKYLSRQGEVLYTIVEDPSYQPDIKLFPVEEGYQFKSYQISEEDGCYIIKPFYEQLSFKVIFENLVGDVLKEETVLYGEGTTPPEMLDTDTQVFVGWISEDETTTNYHSITKDLVFQPVYEAKTFTVSFYGLNNELLKQETVSYGESVPYFEPPVIEGYLFSKWDKSFSFVTSNLTIEAIYIENIPLNNYVSYLQDFNLEKIKPAKENLNLSNLTENLVYTFTNVFYGGFRGTNAIHVYDASNLRQRNAYGYEIAIDEDGFIVESAVNVSLPSGGMIISGHEAGGRQISNNTSLGQYVEYNKDAQTIIVYDAAHIGKCISTEIALNNYCQKIIDANDNYLALDYQTLISKMNQAINLYHQMLENFSNEISSQIDQILIEISFLLVETNGIETKAFWHYPLRAGEYKESNLAEVKEFLLKVYELGFNRVMLNTNFNGGSVYKSDYLTQKKASKNTYTGYKDYLECFIEEAHKLGIEVCAWTNTLICGDGSITTYYTSRDWVQKNYRGEISFGGMYYLDISNPDVQTFLGNIFYELASEYNLDGIEFDFIRYPSSNIASFSGVITNSANINDSGYTDSFLNSFKEKYQIVGDVKSLLLTDVTIRQQWIAYKEELLTSTVEMLVRNIRQAKPEMIISAAMMPSITTAKNVYSQNWLDWVQKGYIDTLEPMIYSGSNSYVLSTMQNFIRTVNNQARVIIGIFPEGDGGATSVVAEQIALITSEYNLSWSKFSGNNVFSNSSMMKGITSLKRSYTVGHNASSVQLVKAFLANSYDLINNYYQYRDQSFNYQQLITLIMETLNRVDTQNNYLELLTTIETEINKILVEPIKTNLSKDLQQVQQLLK